MKDVASNKIICKTIVDIVKSVMYFKKPFLLQYISMCRTVAKFL